MVGSCVSKESRINTCELKRDNQSEYFTHNNGACKHPYETALPHWYAYSLVTVTIQ